MLGPLLFSAFIDDISALIAIPFSLYADDPVIYNKNGNLDFIIQELNRKLQQIHPWAMSNPMRVNTKKTELMLFH